MYEYSATVVAVHDGDTLTLDVDLGFSIHHKGMVVRLYGVDAPELGRPDKLGELARDWVLGWLATHTGPYLLRTVKDRTEKYGRYLAWVEQAPPNANVASLIADGVAAGHLKPYTGHGPRPTWT